MIVTDYKAGDEKKIIEMFELVFGQKMSNEQWNWRFVENPAGSRKIKLMWDGDQLIGHYAVSPITLMVGGEEVFTSHSLTTMTHPDYGGRGIFKKLSMELYNYLENDLSCKSIWGYPNKNSHYGFIKSLGWEDIAVIHTLAKTADQLRPAPESPGLTEITSFTSRHSDLMQRFQKPFQVYVKRSEEYLNWRYVKKPSTDYKIFEVGFQSEEGLLVTKVYKIADDAYDLNIVECNLNDYTVFDSMVQKIIQSYDDININRVSLWKNLHDPSHIIFERLGYTSGMPLTYLSARMVSDVKSQMSAYNNWYVSMGDSDVF